MGLLADDSERRKCLKECFSSYFTALSHFFAVILANCWISNSQKLWDAHKELFIQDLRARNRGNKDTISMLEDDKTVLMYVLHETRTLLSTVKFKLGHFGIYDICQVAKMIRDTYLIILG